MQAISARLYGRRLSARSATESGDEGGTGVPTAALSAHDHEEDPINAVPFSSSRALGGHSLVSFDSREQLSVMVGGLNSESGWLKGLHELWFESAGSDDAILRYDHV